MRLKKEKKSKPKPYKSLPLFELWVFFFLKILWSPKSYEGYRLRRLVTLTKRLEKKLDGNYTRMLQAILNKSWRQHPTRHLLHTYIYWIHTDAIIIKTPDDNDTGTNDARRKEDAGRLLYNIFYVTSLFVSFERVVPSLRVRESWRPNITEIFWPQSYGRQRCVFLVLHGCSTGPWSKLFCVLAFPTTSRLLLSTTVLLVLHLAYLQLSSIRRPYITFKLPRSNIDTPQRLRNLFRFPATGMCHFLPVYHLEWHFWPGQKVKT